MSSDVPEYHTRRKLTNNRWIAGKISEILGNEDDVVIELCFNLLEGSRFVSGSLAVKPCAILSRQSLIVRPFFLASCNYI